MKGKKEFDGCADIHSLRFDFYLPQYNTAIEYQGIQHFEPVEYFGGEEKFVIRVRHDKIKKEYCKTHDIKLYYINYNEVVQDKLDELLQNEDMVWPYGNIAG